MTRSVAGDLALLTGPGAVELVQAVLATSGEELAGWSVRTVEARDGTGATASYLVRVRTPDGERPVLLAASTRALSPGRALPPGALSLPCGEDRRVVVWRWPEDPWLPALPLAGDAGALRRLLGARPHDELQVRVRAYRPARRAVVHVARQAGEVFVKVVRPARWEALRERHRLLATGALPVPEVLGHDPRGLLVLAGAAGVPMRERLRSGGPVPSGGDLLALLEQLPVELLDLPRRPSWSASAGHYAAVLDAALTGVDRPDQAARAQALAAAVATGLDGTDPAPEPVHGDLYEGQLLLGADGRVTGLLDVDSAGPGRRADDLACLLGHLDVLAAREPSSVRGTRALAGAWQTAFAQQVDPRELRLRTAGVLLSLATGPHRVQEDGWVDATVERLDLAERWAAAADGRR